MPSIRIDVAVTPYQAIAIAFIFIGVLFVLVALGVISYREGKISVHRGPVTGLIGIALMLIGSGIGVFLWKPLFRPLALPETATLS